MNKFVLLLGVIVLVTLAIMFFCVGFFTGSTISTSDIVSMVQKEVPDAKVDQKITAKNVGEITDAKSLTISDKILGILNAAGSATESFSNIVQGNKTSSKKVEKKKIKNNTLTIDSLLREIAATHNVNDDCSYEKTRYIIDNNYPITDRNLFGKKIVFIGYFKNDIAAQIQGLLTTKGYKVHIEHSKSGNADESFVFCGPFEKEKNANRLVEWLKEHDFGDARVIDVVKEVKEDALFNTIKDNSDNMPINEETISMHQNGVSIGHHVTVSNENIQHINHETDFGNQATNNVGHGEDMIANNNMQHMPSIMHNGTQIPIMEQQVNHNLQNHMVVDQPYGAVIPNGVHQNQQIQMIHPQQNTNMSGHNNISVPQM